MIKKLLTLFSAVLLFSANGFAQNAPVDIYYSGGDSLSSSIILWNI